MNNQLPNQCVFTDCSVVNTSAANEHTRAAVEALSAAAKANADAIAEIARALRGSEASMGSGFRIDAPSRQPT
jgi:hypothetical protein